MAHDEILFMLTVLLYNSKSHKSASVNEYQGKQSYHNQWKVMHILSGQKIISMKHVNLKYYAQED